MGNSFNNVNIRKKDGIGLNEVKDSLCRVLRNDGFAPVENGSDSDGSCIVLCGENSAWFTVCSDLISFETPDDFEVLADSISAELNTDVMGVACFDSGLLYLNLINRNDKTNAWASVGKASEFGINRRNNFSAWKEKVTDIDLFTKLIKKKRVFAEEALEDISPVLLLPAEQSVTSAHYAEEGEFPDVIARLYFKRTENAENNEPPVFKLHHTNTSVFKMEAKSEVSFINEGGASQGVYVYFLGNYVENDEITFSDVTVGGVHKELEKIQLSNGEWAYRAYYPEMQIPAIDKNLKGAKLVKVQYEKCITVSFVAHGNQRKTLDITVVLVPEKHWNGQGHYYAWRGCSSKREYIRANNARVLEMDMPAFFLMNEDDYDL